MFSSRVRPSSGRNRLSMALERRKTAGLPVIDLTLSNPTRAGFTYPKGILDALAEPEALTYDPRPFGLPSAREAVCGEFARRGVSIAPERVVLTASTSEGYSLLFKLLCDPGDIVLAPRPSYPLIEHLAEFDAVRVEHYALDFHGRWSIDVDAIDAQLSRAPSRRVRAIILVSPNNPTGSVATRTELAAIGELASRYGVALISDEVFADYTSDNSVCPSAASAPDALTFVLGGLSKSAGLPQAKLGWIAVDGPITIVDDAMERLETICDAYLSVSTPVQIAASQLLTLGTAVRTQIQQRIRGSIATMTNVAGANASCSMLPIEGGWYGVVQVPAVTSEENLVVTLLEQAGVLVHPGYFFDFDREAFVVISLLPQPEDFAAGLSALFDAVG